MFSLASSAAFWLLALPIASLAAPTVVDTAERRDAGEAVARASGVRLHIQEGIEIRQLN